MKQEITTIVKKSAKVGAAVCVAAGAVALMTSGAALTALAAGGRYLTDTVKKIVAEKPAEAAPAEEIPEAAEADFEETESQEA